MLILGGEFGLLTVHLGVVCSTWSIVNRATSQRDELVPFGQNCFLSVRRANKMVARTEVLISKKFQWDLCRFFISSNCLNEYLVSASFGKISWVP